MIRAGHGDLDDIRAFLKQRDWQAMFPLVNLDRHGIDGGHPRAVRMWLSRDDCGAVTDVLSVTKEGMVMPMLPSGDWAAAAKVLDGLMTFGFVGPAEQCRPLKAAMGLTNAPATLDHDEPQFLLGLDALRMPPAPEGERFVSIGDAPRAVVEQWRVDYDVEALRMDRAKAEAEGSAEIAGYIAADSHRVLMAGGEPVCLTGFNAALPDIVQIGGVYTPPAHRGRGYARRAVALHLAEAKAKGASRATLFSASDGASRAYRAIGFEEVGRWTLCLHDGLQEARSCN